jgi:hypothetical protein
MGKRISPKSFSAEQIQSRIFLILGQRIMLDRDLAQLYGVRTEALNQAVKRNRGRFPEDFMFRLNWEESLELSRSQIVILKRGRNIKYRPFVFTEQGVAMLSSVLNSERAVQVNIAIMRVFVRLKQTLSAHRGLAQKLEELERKIESHDEQIRSIFNAIRQLMAPPEPSRRRIGFRGS